MTKMTKPAQSNQWSHFVPVKIMPPIFQYDILNQDYTKPFCWHRNNPTVKNTLPIMKNIFSHLKKFGEAKAIICILYRTIIESWNHFSNQLFQRTEISKPKKAPKFDPDILKIGNGNSEKNWKWKWKFRKKLRALILRWSFNYLRKDFNI